MVSNILSPERAAKLLLFKSVNIKNAAIQYYGCVGGDHRFMAGGYYYSVDLVINKVRRTA